MTVTLIPHGNKRNPNHKVFTAVKRSECGHYSMNLLIDGRLWNRTWERVNREWLNTEIMLVLPKGRKALTLSLETFNMLYVED